MVEIALDEVEDSLENIVDDNVAMDAIKLLDPF